METSREIPTMTLRRYRWTLAEIAAALVLTALAAAFLLGDLTTQTPPDQASQITQSETGTNVVPPAGQ